MHIRFGRRALGAMAGGALAFPMLGRNAWAADPITVTSFGGVFETTIREVIVADYEKRTGNKARVLGGSPEQWMAQVEANRAHPPIDVLFNQVDTALVAGRAGLVEKLTVDRVPNMADMPLQLVEMLEGWGMVFTFGSWGFAHHERLKEPPRSFAELVDGTIKGKWRVALPNAGYTGTPQVLIWALADALGGSVDNVDPAFDAIKKMKPNAAFFASITDPLPLLESGEVDISLYADGRTWAAYDSGAKWIRFVNPKEGAVNLPSIVQKVKNGSDLAWEYINSMLSPGPQSEVVKRLNYETSNPKATLPPEIKARITPWQQCRFAPAERVAKAKAGWIERWNKEINA